ncbi:TRI59 protein, partial [Todus mexicanus]|nr:TRI59 protein [Todus mexicanus]
LQQLEEDLTCSICFSILEDPRVLPCAHTFCRSCLEGLIETNFGVWRSPRAPLKCPNCRRVVEIPTAGIESLPVNFALQGILEKYHREYKARETCSEHLGQPLNVYCILDRKLVCGHCLTVGEHSGHPIDDLENAYRKEKKASGKLTEQLTDQHWNDVCLLLEKLKEQKSRCEGIIQDERKAVVQYFKKFSDTLEQKKQGLLSALEEVNTRVLQEYDPPIDKLKRIREEQLKLMSLNAAIRNEESPLAFLEKVGELQQRIKALREEKLPDVKAVEISPRVGHLFRSMYSKTEIGHLSKIVAPEIKLIPKRKVQAKDGGEEGRELKELLRAVEPVVALPLLFLVVVMVLSFHKPVLSAVVGAASAFTSELLLPGYQAFHTHFQNTVDVLWHKFNLLMEFWGRIVPL